MAKEQFLAYFKRGNNRNCYSPELGLYYRELVQLRIIAVSTLKSFWEKTPKYEDSRAPLLAWYRHALTADWDTPSAIKNDFANASILQDGRAVFNIGGNKYRLVVWKIIAIELFIFALLALTNNMAVLTLRQFNSIDEYKTH